MDDRCLSASLKEGERGVCESGRCRGVAVSWGFCVPRRMTNKNPIV